MLSYEDFTIRITEGLILTHPLSKCKNVIDFEASKLDYWKKINFNETNNTFHIDFDGIPTEAELEYLFLIYNNLGYYVSYYKIFNLSNQDKFFPWYDIKEYLKTTNNKKSIVLFFEAKFDEQLKYIPKKLYHVTNDKSIKKINKYGLTPKYFEAGDYRPDRLYFSLSIKDSNNILSKKIFNDNMKDINNSYIVYEIETNNIPNLILYKDPRSNGCYTYNHIHPNKLTVIQQ
jgi:hypothetical protein